MKFLIATAVLPVDTVSLPVCAFGAGIAHAAALALVLPMMITLPAPSESSISKLVAIPVTIVADVGSAPPDLVGALMAETGPEDEAISDRAEVPAENTPDNDDDITTAALPAPVAAETPEQLDVPAVDSAAAEPVAAEPDHPGSAKVANVEAAVPPLPVRVRRDDNGEAIPTPAPSGPSAGTGARASSKACAPRRHATEARLFRPCQAERACEEGKRCSAL